MVHASDSSALHADGRVQDASAGNWVDRWCPPRLRPWLRLSRADRPIGTWLLLIPCWWAIALAAVAGGWQWFDISLVLGSGLGAFLMRGAGCTWNDITDRDIDAAVARTRSRPLPSGQVATRGALAWAVAQSLLAFLILLTFGAPAIWCGIASLGLVAIYPFAKRFTDWPQIFLGLAFNWGALLLWVAKTGGLGFAPVFLYLAGIAWTLHYDTIYAHQDRDDDELIGVRSTALLFGEETKRMLWLFVATSTALMLLALLAANGGWVGLMGIALFAGHLSWQVLALDIDDPAQCLGLFKANRTSGLLLLAGFVIDSLI